MVLIEVLEAGHTKVSCLGGRGGGGITTLACMMKDFIECFLQTLCTTLKLYLIYLISEIYMK